VKLPETERAARGDTAGQRRGVWRDLSWLMPLAGLLLFMPPIMGLFDHHLYVLGLPLLPLYLFAVWLLGIVLTAVVARRLRKADADA